MTIEAAVQNHLLQRALKDRRVTPLLKDVALKALEYTSTVEGHSPNKAALQFALSRILGRYTTPYQPEPTTFEGCVVAAWSHTLSQRDSSSWAEKAESFFLSGEVSTYSYLVLQHWLKATKHLSQGDLRRMKAEFEVALEGCEILGLDSSWLRWVYLSTILIFPTSQQPSEGSKHPLP